MPGPRLEAILELRERRPARVLLFDLVLVRLDVQIASRRRGRDRRSRAAEDLVGEREHDGVAGPAREVELVVVEVGRRRARSSPSGWVAWYSRPRICETLRSSRSGSGSRARRGATRTRARRGGPRSSRLIVSSASRRGGAGDVALSAELDRVELDLTGVATLLAGAKLDRAKIERGHASQSSARGRRRPRCEARGSRRGAAPRRTGDSRPSGAGARRGSARASRARRSPGRSGRARRRLVRGPCARTSSRPSSRGRRRPPSRRAGRRSGARRASPSGPAAARAPSRASCQETPSSLVA